MIYVVKADEEISRQKKRSWRWSKALLLFFAIISKLLVNKKTQTLTLFFFRNFTKLVQPFWKHYIPPKINMSPETGAFQKERLPSNIFLRGLAISIMSFQGRKVSEKWVFRQKNPFPRPIHCILVSTGGARFGPGSPPSTSPSSIFTPTGPRLERPVESLFGFQRPLGTQFRGNKTTKVEGCFGDFWGTTGRIGFFGNYTTSVGFTYRAKVLRGYRSSQGLNEKNLYTHFPLKLYVSNHLVLLVCLNQTDV